MRKSSADFGKIVTLMCDLKDVYWHENEILKTMLLEQGLSSRQIDAQLRKRLKQRQIRETAIETLLKCSREIAAIVQKIDPLKQLEELRAETEKHKMN